MSNLSERDDLVVVCAEGKAPIFQESLFTHRGLTGPAVKRGRWADGVFTWNVHLWEKR